MPQYEYFCHACKRSFSKTLTPAEYEEGSYARTAATRRLPQVFVPRLSVIYDCATGFAPADAGIPPRDHSPNSTVKSTNFPHQRRRSARMIVAGIRGERGSPHQGSARSFNRR
jgi:hypothetical protein